MRFYVIPAMALAAMVLTACATPIPAHVALDPAARASIDSTEVVAPVKQSEIYIYVPPSRAGASAGAAAGVLGALVGSAIDAGVNSHNAQTAEASVKPLRDAAVDYSFDQKLTGDLQSSLGKVAWLKVDGVRVVRDVAPESLSTVITSSKHGAVLVIGGDYQLNTDGSVLTVTLAVDMFANNDGLKKFKPTKTANEKIVYHPGNAIYRARFVQTEVTTGTGHDRDANIALWSADGGKPLRAALDKAVDDLTAQVAEDIQSDSSAPWQSKSGK